MKLIQVLLLVRGVLSLPEYDPTVDPPVSRVAREADSSVPALLLDSEPGIPNLETLPSEFPSPDLPPSDLPPPGFHLIHEPHPAEQPLPPHLNREDLPLSPPLPRGDLPLPPPLHRGDIPLPPPLLSGELSLTPPQHRGDIPFPPPLPRGELPLPPPQHRGDIHLPLKSVSPDISLNLELIPEDLPLLPPSSAALPVHLHLPRYPEDVLVPLNPTYTPEKPAPIPSKAKCRIEEVQLTATICTPTIKKKCESVKLKTKGLVNKEDCIKIVRTVCSEETEEVKSEVCFYEYNKEDLDTEAKTANVTYEKRCESTQQENCPQNQGYGHGHCSTQKTKVCYNEAHVAGVRVPVTVARPVAKKVCQDLPVRLPKVVCQDVMVEKCLSLPHTEEDSVTLEKCRAILGEQECKDTVLTLPKQICEEIKEAYYPPPPAPGYAPAPSYGAPVPSYQPAYAA